MYEKVEGNIKSSGTKVERYGDGHSLGGHLIVTLGLITKNFKDVRGMTSVALIYFHY